MTRRPTSRREPPVRLAGEGQPQTAQEAWLATYFRDPPGVEPLSPQAFARVRRRLAAAQSSGWSARPWGWAVAAALLLSTLQIGVAAVGGWRKAWQGVVGRTPAAPTGQAAAPHLEPFAAEALHAAPTPSPEPAPTVALPAAAKPPAPSPVRPGVASRSRGWRPAGVTSAERPPATPVVGPAGAAAPRSGVAVPTPAPAAGGASAALAREAALLSAAVHRSSGAAGARQALLAVDTYRREFPRGALGREADFAELEAHLALGQSGQALPLVERLESGAAPVPRAEELHLLRGELLAQLGRCGEALAFLRASTSAGSELRERALYGQSNCLAALGRGEEARSALAAYLEAFPQGRFAAPARRSLGVPQSDR